MTIASDDAVLAGLEGYRPILFTADGVVIHQNDEINEALRICPN